MLKLIFFIPVSVMLAVSPLVAETGGAGALQQGLYWFSKKCEGTVAGYAPSMPIDKAITYFKQALTDRTVERKAGEMLLYSYYFKGSYVNLTEEQQEAVYASGKSMGEQLLAKYPNDPAIKFWYMANLGGWGMLIGKLQAAKDGVTDQIKQLCEDVIAMAPEYHQAGGYRVLGALHYKLPRIPFILSWPSDETAMEYLSKAYKLAPEHPANCYHYAMILDEYGRTDESIRILEEIISRTPRQEMLVEDMRIIERSRESLAEIR